MVGYSSGQNLDGIEWVGQKSEGRTADEDGRKRLITKMMELLVSHKSSIALLGAMLLPFWCRFSTPLHYLLICKCSLVQEQSA